MIPIIGGKADGHESPLRTHYLELDGETYVAITSKESDGKDHTFFMLTGMAPIEALKIYRERCAKRRDIWGK